MSNPLRWNAWLRLDDLTVHDAQPLCECCDGTGKITFDDPPIDYETCPDCHGKGFAPSWHIVPTAGMLYAAMGAWRYCATLDYVDDVQSEFSDATLLLPPASLCDRAESLRLLQGYTVSYESECAIATLPLGGGLQALFIGESDIEPTIVFDPHYSAADALDPDAVILAANRIKALAEWLKGAKG